MFCAVEEGETPETYPYGITSLADKRDFLQKGDIVNFQVTKVKGNGVLRATNLAAQRKYIRAKVDSVKGQVLSSVCVCVCAESKDKVSSELQNFFMAACQLTFLWLFVKPKFTVPDFKYFADVVDLLTCFGGCLSRLDFVHCEDFLVFLGVVGLLTCLDLCSLAF